MANALPWSVRGIDPDIREQAVEAAHRSGLSVGQWLNQVLAGNLDEPDAYEEEARARRPSRRPARRYDDLNDRLERLGQNRTQTAAHRFAGRDNDQEAMLDLIENAVHAIERVERHGAAPSKRGNGDQAALAEMIAGLERKLEALAQPARPEPPRAVEPALERRLEQLTAQLGQLNAARPAAMATRGFADADPAFTLALAEIESRRRSLDGESVAGEAPAMRGSATGLDAMRQQLDLLVSRIDEMRASPQADPRHLQNQFDSLASRIEEWRAKPQDEIVALRSDLASLAHSVEKLAPQRLIELVEDAVAGMARLQREGLPERLAEPIDRVHEDVRAVLREISATRGSDRLTQEVSNIARRLDLISEAAAPGRLDEIARETASIKTLVTQAVRAQPLEGLAHQIEALGRQVEKFQRSPAGNDRAVLDAVREVSDRLERIDPAAATKGIEAKLAEITREMKKLAKDVQPLPHLDTITERLERIDRVLENTKGKSFAGIDALAERLEKIGHSLDRAEANPPANDHDALVGMLERLSERMDSAQKSNADAGAFDALHQEIARLARQIEGAGQNPAGLDGIARNIGDLFAQIDEARRDMRDVADQAATRAAQEAVKNAPRDEASDTLAAEGLLLIKRDLNEFKTAQSEAERRTRATLEALHTTLETMVGRLGEIEKRETAAPAPARMEQRPEARIEPRIDAAPVMPKATPVMPKAATLDPVRAAHAGAASTVAEPDARGDLPLEPGIQPGAAPAEAAPSADPRQNYIAAARRAAQVAASKSQQALAEEKPVRAGKAGRIDAGAAATSFIVRARKPLLLGLAALVFSMGALKVLTSRNSLSDSGTPPMPPKPAVTTPQSGETSEPQSTGSTATKGGQADQQQLPIVQQNAVPPIGIAPPSLGQTGINAMPGKRGQRLSDASAITQADPMTVGSLGVDGSSRPVETGRTAINELLGEGGLKAPDRLREAALAGNTGALFEIGSRFADGKGVVRDPKLAARWFEQAAASGHGPSQYRLGSLYREGRGIAKDSALAFQWFDRAASQGHVLAMHNAAVLLAEGVHGAPDYAGAALWFKRAAEHGIKDSQFNVAILFARGLGVNQDLGESYRWFAIAANQGDPDAAKKRDDIAARLTKEQLAKEQERVKAFKPTRPVQAANDPGPWDNAPRQGT